MQAPINRKSQKYPKDFLAIISPKKSKQTNLYTFNHGSSVHESGINYNQPNPYQNQNQLIFHGGETNPEQSAHNGKVHYDAQSNPMAPRDRSRDIMQINKDNKINKYNKHPQQQFINQFQQNKNKDDAINEKIPNFKQPNSKLNTNNHHGANQRYASKIRQIHQNIANLNQFDNQLLEVQQNGQLQNNSSSHYNGEFKNKSEISGTIVKQKVIDEVLDKRQDRKLNSKSNLNRYGGLQEEEQQTTNSRVSQKQFNRLALSLMGIKRAKFNNSCMGSTSKNKLQASNSNMQPLNRQTSPQRFRMSRQIESHIQNQIFRINRGKSNKRQSSTNLRQSGILEKYQQSRYKQKCNSARDASSQNKKLSSTNIKAKSKQHNDTQIYEHTYYPFRAKQIQDIKDQINFISNASRLKKANGPNATNLIGSLYQQYENVQQNIQNAELYASNPSVDNSNSHPNTHSKIIRKNQLKINIKTSLSQLKNLLSFNLKERSLSIQLPQFFIKPPSQLTKIQSFDPEILNNQCIQIFSGLQIPIVNINIKKYSNCVVIVNQNICIVWHEGKLGKKYIGSWKNKYFDEGDKEGLGLQWSPGRYVYYGQFKDNKRNGFGLMRKSDHSIILGYWKNGKNIEFGIQKNYIY